jgi:hypothetical protein
MTSMGQSPDDISWDSALHSTLLTTPSLNTWCLLASITPIVLIFPPTFLVYLLPVLLLLLDHEVLQFLRILSWSSTNLYALSRFHLLPRFHTVITSDSWCLFSIVTCISQRYFIANLIILPNLHSLHLAPFH